MSNRANTLEHEKVFIVLVLTSNVQELTNQKHHCDFTILIFPTTLHARHLDGLRPVEGKMCTGDSNANQSDREKLRLPKHPCEGGGGAAAVDGPNNHTHSLLLHMTSATANTIARPLFIPPTNWPAAPVSSYC